MLVRPITVNRPNFLTRLYNIMGWSNYVWSRAGETNKVYSPDVFPLGSGGGSVQSGPHDVGISPCYHAAVNAFDEPAESTYAYWRLFQPLMGPTFLININIITAGGIPSGSTMFAIPDGTIDWDPFTLTWNNQPASIGLLSNPTIYPSMAMAQNNMPPVFTPSPHFGPGTEFASMNQFIRWDLSSFGRPIIGVVIMPYLNGSLGESGVGSFHLMNLENVALLDQGKIPHRFLNVVARQSIKADPLYSGRATQIITFDTEHHFFPTTFQFDPGTNIVGWGIVLGISGVSKGGTNNYDSTPNLLGQSTQVQMIQVVDKFSLKYFSRGDLVDEPKTPCRGQVELIATGY